ncbi:MAG TPA: DUF434 domain-containing protein [Pyrinomonadaceae bacterium]|nr:DUF434 domain-containing protein [Pyrinomonadaceae bacterium]
MSPDTRRHRGPHPADAELFGAGELSKLRHAVSDLCWLLSRGYKMTSALKLVGDRHGLRERQRVAVSRSACSDQDRQRRKDHCVGAEQLKDQRLTVDGFNLIITIEAALSGGPLLIGVDDCIRDLSSVHGSYRSVDETDRAIAMIGDALERLGPSSVHWLLDRPVSNSGRLAAKIADLAAHAKWSWTVETVFNPDAAIVASPSIAITSDSSILDRVNRWVDFKTYLLEHEVPEAWKVDLRSPVTDDTD